MSEPVLTRLEKVDKELHLVIEELREKASTESSKRDSPDEIRRLFRSKLKTDVDTTELIKEMRSKRYEV